MSNTLLIRHLVGRCANGAERDKGRLWHAVRYDHLATLDLNGVALCGARPGPRSNGWGPFPPIRDSDQIPTLPTCAKCRQKFLAHNADVQTGIENNSTWVALRLPGL